MNHTPEIIAAAAAGLIAIGIFVIVPIVGIVLRHQRQITGHNVETASRDRVAALESQVKELRDRLNEHALMLDGRVPAPTSVSERLKG